MNDLLTSTAPGQSTQASGNRRLSPPVRAAFTLVELLVAMVVTLLLVVVLTQVFNGAARTWQHSEAQIDAYREARGALQIMARDLSSTLQASYAQAGGGTGSLIASPIVPTLALQRSSEPAVPNGPSSDLSRGPINDEVYFLTNLNQGGSSSLCAVGYYCAWLPDFLPSSNDNVDHKPRAYGLIRQSLDSNGTYQRLKAVSTSNSTSPVQFADLFSRAGAPAPSLTQLAAYIWDLRFRIDTDLNDSTVPDGNPTPGPLDHSNPQRSYDGRGNQAHPYPPLLPTYVEIRFKALSDQAARRLEGAPNVDPSTWLDTDNSAIHQQIIQPNFQQFVLRVPLTSAVAQPTPTP